ALERRGGVRARLIQAGIGESLAAVGAERGAFARVFEVPTATGAEQRHGEQPGSGLSMEPDSRRGRPRPRGPLRATGPRPSGRGRPASEENGARPLPGVRTSIIGAEGFILSDSPD